MKALFRILVGLGFLALVGFAAFRMLFGGAEVSWRQRLTVTVQTPAGEVSGSSVTAVTLRDYTTGALVLPDARKLQGEVAGEAVVVEIVPGRYLFVLLDGVAHWVYPAFGMGQEKSHSAAMRRLKAQPEDTPFALPPDAYPLMVTFDDITDPKTVRQVDLKAAFGPGVSLKEVTLAVTDEPLTEGRVEPVLGWLPKYKENQWRLNAEKCVARPVNGESLADLMHPSDFLIWEN
jgi:hypothetical protein